jgi:hypothetical protein
LGPWYIECWDFQIEKKVENIGPLCYGKSKILYNKLIANKFMLGIMVKILQKPMSWATFAKQINIIQCSSEWKSWSCKKKISCN